MLFCSVLVYSRIYVLFVSHKKLFQKGCVMRLTGTAKGFSRRQLNFIASLSLWGIEFPLSVHIHIHPQGSTRALSGKVKPSQASKPDSSERPLKLLLCTNSSTDRSCVSRQKIPFSVCNVSPDHEETDRDKWKGSRPSWDEWQLSLWTSHESKWFPRNCCWRHLHKGTQHACSGVKEDRPN